MHNQKSHYKNMQESAIKIQCFVRYCQANVRRHELLESLKLKRVTSACTIQSKFRMYYYANRYAIQKAKAIKIQSMLRMHNQKSHYKNMQESAIKIQCFVRYCQANVRRHELLESLKLKRV